MTGVRARVRAELTGEIKAIARRQIASDGATGLSLRAISRELGMASSAIYRYFPGRDELLTALIVDAYDTFGMIAERADESVAPGDASARWSAVCLAAFDWARSNTAEFALIFGTPVPGYVAPDDTIAPATRFTNVLIAILLAAGERGGGGPGGLVPRVSRATRRELGVLGRQIDGELDPSLLFLGIHAWTSLIGTISFILFGHLENIIADHDSFFADLVGRLGDELFGPSDPS